jgi:hypothetical protein
LRVRRPQAAWCVELKPCLFAPPPAGASVSEQQLLLVTSRLQQQRRRAARGEAGDPPGGAGGGGEGGDERRGDGGTPEWDVLRGTLCIDEFLMALTDACSSSSGSSSSSSSSSGSGSSSRSSSQDCGGGARDGGKRGHAAVDLSASSLAAVEAAARAWLRSMLAHLPPATAAVSVCGAPGGEGLLVCRLDGPDAPPLVALLAAPEGDEARCVQRAAACAARPLARAQVSPQIAWLRSGARVCTPAYGSSHLPSARVC